MAASLRTLVRSRSEKVQTRRSTTSTSAAALDPISADNNGSIPSRGKLLYKLVPNITYTNTQDLYILCIKPLP